MSKIGITVDVDWAPDFMIDFTFKIISATNGGVKTNWFFTHKSELLLKLYEDKNIEPGLHPNFSVCSDMNSAREAMRYLVSVYPKCKIVRCHKQHQSVDLMRMVADEFGMEIDSTELLFRYPGALPFRYYPGASPIVKFPYVWEDCMEARRISPEWTFPLGSVIAPYPIYNFHPIHVYLNTFTTEKYEAIKSGFAQARDLSFSDVLPYVNKGGVGALPCFVSLLASNREKVFISEMVKEWKENETIGID